MRRTPGLQTKAGTMVITIAIIITGVLLLLKNFLFIEFDLMAYWPVLLILVGLQLFWRGDLGPGWEAHTFGITRGSVQSASLEINSGEIDVHLQVLKRAGRLIAGQYTARSRPHLAVRNNHAMLEMQRAHTWWFSLADWEIEIAHDIPWSLLVSSHLGEIDVDLRDIPLTKAHIASGIGNIRVISPNYADLAAPIYIRSNFGDIHIIVPAGVEALIEVKASRLCRVVAPRPQFKVDTTGKFYATQGFRSGESAVHIVVAGVFGNILLQPGE